ncbi:nucleotide exchange factor GrpE [Weeksellaceae bacterium KMM 9724]|uniref:nucleotide exchange factor GrpE n=1 Tax=Profundicola chukchiensis TaxID=2961959 RepID=UPI002440C102|nr:nucleotide exchange factor GrpE [Profundicola chukchiensis]MDG4951376.1 nucleotide exchange factor GrpE [Profundicola chukchiensis]
MDQENKENLDENLDQVAEETHSEAQEEQTKNADNKTSLADELAMQKDKNLRLFAEFENYKKRTTKERLDLYKTANESLLGDLLPVLDDFERATFEISKAEDEGLLKGVELIHSKLVNILKNKGLEAIETSAGDDFDIDKHEAITQVPSPSDDLKGKIVDVVETGYMLNEKVIRYTKVVVGK